LASGALSCGVGGGGTREHGWLRHYATKPGSRGFASRPNRSSGNMALGWTQPLTEMNTRNFPGG
jgi:hypothetical protein